MLIYHQPVFLDFFLEYLRRNPPKFILDATLGEGGHSWGFLNAERENNSSLKVHGLDLDRNILAKATERLKKFNQQFKSHWGNFIHLETLFPPSLQFDFILFDLGISKFHYFASQNGFSFAKNEFLDMRLNKSEKNSLTAERIINHYSQDDLVNIFTELGEESSAIAKRCARLIIQKRKKNPIRKTFQLCEIINQAYGRVARRIKINPATKIFQALRIQTNRELDNLRLGIDVAIKKLSSQGILFLISYHSLEDRIIKKIFNEFVQKNENYNKYKINKKKSPFLLFNKKVIKPIREEVKNNSAARSAKLRGIIKND